MLPAYLANALYVDLSNSKITKKPLPVNLVKNYLGGKGLGTRLLYDSVEPTVDPLEPENKLIFATGPATGTIVPNKGYILCFKSPLTGIYASCSSGGHFAVELKQSGHDILIIEGRSRKPVYLYVEDSEIQIKDAKHLWGKDTFETNDMIKEEIGDNEVSVARIGPAGERLVKIAGIFNDYSRAAGRCGPGAVMGSKNLKAIAVRGTGSIEVANIEELLEYAKEISDDISKKMFSYQEYGTPASISLINGLGIFPTRYWQKQIFSKWEKIGATAIANRVLAKSKACTSCGAHCGKLCAVKEGSYAGSTAEIDYETLWALGGLCENGNLESIVKANEICDRLGIDTMSAGSIIAFSMECYEHGIITKKETGDVELVWGNHEAVVDMVRKIALKEGFGEVLAEGVRGAAKRLGKAAERIAVHVKGLEPPGFDPRGVMGGALSFAVADRGGCHLPGSLYTLEVKGLLDPHSIEGKAKLLKELEERFAVCDSLILCRFVSRDIYTWERLEALVPILTGLKIEKEELKRMGERIVMLTRAFNVRNGISRKDDAWPERFFEEPISEGPMKGRTLIRDEFNKMINDYYELKGWDENGIPTSKRLSEIGLADIVT
jgi:aldehyde:ferredoxin oxidoreductase